MRCTWCSRCIACDGTEKPGIRSLTEQELRNKIAGGWAGKMIGVSYGGPTEFRSTGPKKNEQVTLDVEQ